MDHFRQSELKKLSKPSTNSSGEDNGQVTIIGGSSLFHGAPLLSLKVASRIVDMVFFASPDPSVSDVASKAKAALFSFVWVPWEETGEYVKKSDAVLIGPGFMSFRGEKDRRIVDKTKEITKQFLTSFPSKKWVIDAGSLQVMDPGWIPENAILTPNKKEYISLFGEMGIDTASKKYACTIVLKGVETIVSTKGESIVIKGGNPGLTKGGTGDTQAGLTVALLAKNAPALAASAASFLVKKAAERLSGRVGTMFNADDLANFVPDVFQELTK